MQRLEQAAGAWAGAVGLIIRTHRDRANAMVAKKGELKPSQLLLPNMGVLRRCTSDSHAKKWDGHRLIGAGATRRRRKTPSKRHAAEPYAHNPCSACCIAGVSARKNQMSDGATVAKRAHATDIG